MSNRRYDISVLAFDDGLLALDKVQAIKPLEESAELIEAWKDWFKHGRTREQRAAVLSETADVIQSVVNLMASMDIDAEELQSAVLDCGSRNAARGRLSDFDQSMRDQFRQLERSDESHGRTEYSDGSHVKSTSYENHRIRYDVEDGHVWFYAADVYLIAGYSGADKMMRMVRKDEMRYRESPISPGMRDNILINEMTVYRLVTNRMFRAERHGERVDQDSDFISWMDSFCKTTIQ